MPYVTLGSRGPLAAELDNTGLNPGNWTTAFTAAVLGAGVAWFELYRAIVQDVPAGAAALVQVGIKPFSYTYPAGGSEWDPQQPLILTPGQDLYFLWSVAATGVPPKTTIWLRYDPALEGNQS